MPEQESSEEKAPLYNRLKFSERDPLFHLHVPRRKRKTEDEGPASDATDEITGEVTEIDSDEVRSRDWVVPPEFLQ